MHTRGLHWAFAYVLHALVACIVLPLCAGLAGLLVSPRFVSLDPYQGPYFWGPVLFGLGGGALLGRSERPLLLLLLCLLPAIQFYREYLTYLHSSSKEVAAKYMFDNYLGSNCGGTECLGQLFVTTPLVGALCYTIGALLTHAIVPTHSTVS